MKSYLTRVRKFAMAILHGKLGLLCDKMYSVIHVLVSNIEYKSPWDINPEATKRYQGRSKLKILSFPSTVIVLVKLQVRTLSTT